MKAPAPHTPGSCAPAPGAEAAPGAGAAGNPALPGNAVSRGRMSLPELRPMEIAVVVELDAAEEDVLRLKHLGVCSGRRVQLVKAGDPLILRVLGSACRRDSPAW